ncbi:hypothetical protein [Amycolatopsis sp. FDAARGOS 1241]|uniref:hypothetical protein n=1 Tax=Amycolatopsis sp. FDAARGOS 1241 TaxID=2778070 RepID=UPI00194DAFC0|nr:hypothetical protein [Amycolatopsis sp. FDAARGOS 1241]QRP47663.1 hypothetical protein I6J71_06945 [Amycolatopsis sp. FDAARGOS 1241]
MTAPGLFRAVVAHMTLMLMAGLDTVGAEAARVLMARGVFAAVVGWGRGHRREEVFHDLARPMFDAVPEARRAPDEGDRRTRTREGFDGILGPVGFEPVAWDQLVIEFDAPPEQAWAMCCETLYPADALATRSRSASRPSSRKRRANC